MLKEDRRPAEFNHLDIVVLDYAVFYAMESLSQKDYPLLSFISLFFLTFLQVQHFHVGFLLISKGHQLQVIHDVTKNKFFSI